MQMERYPPKVKLASTLDMLPVMCKSRMEDQHNWISYWNRLTQEGLSNGRVFACFPDLYQAGKIGSDALHRSLRKDFGAGLITSTHIGFHDDLSAMVTHYYLCNAREPIEIDRLEVPFRRNANYRDLAEFLGIPSGLKFVQALCNTADDYRTIIETLKRIVSDQNSRLGISLPMDFEARQIPQRAVAFSWKSFGGYTIGCDYFFSRQIGLSRGVRFGEEGKIMR